MLSRTTPAFGFAEMKPLSFRGLVARAKETLRRTPAFLKTCYVDGLLAIIGGRYSRRQAALIITAMLPVLLTTALITVPLILFPTEGHRAYFQFASILSTEPVSLIPMLIGSVSATLGLKVPLG